MVRKESGRIHVGAKNLAESMNGVRFVSCILWDFHLLRFGVNWGSW